MKSIPYLICLFAFFAWQSPLFATVDSLKAYTLFKEGRALYYEGKHKAARAPLQESLELHKKIYGAIHEKVASVLMRMGKNERRIRNHPAALAYLEKGLEITRQLNEGVSQKEGGFFMELATVHQQAYRLRKALQYNEKSKAIFERYHGYKSELVAGVIMNTGNIYNKMGHYYDADKHYAEAFSIYQEVIEPDSKDMYRIYNNWGQIIKDLGDYDRALNFAKKALEIKLKHVKPGDPSLGKYYLNISRIYEQKGNFEKALSYTKKALEIEIIGQGKDHVSTYGTTAELAIIYTKLNHYDKAIPIFQKAIEGLEKHLPPNHPDVISTYKYMAVAYADQGKTSKALGLYQKAIQQAQNADYIPENQVAGLQLAIAKLKFKAGQIDSALELIQQAFSKIATDFSSTQIKFANPSIDQVQDEILFLELLQFKAQFLAARFKRDQELPDLEHALATSELAIKVIEKMRTGYQSESAKQFLNTQTAPVYNQAVEQVYDLFENTAEKKYLEKAFQIIDKSKASILWQNASKNNALQARAIPIETLDSLDFLQEQIADLEEKIFEANGSEQKTAQNQIFDLKNKYRQQVKTLEKHNRAYYELKYASAEVNISQIQKKLPKASALLQYFLDDAQQLYLFLVTQNKIKGLRIPISFDLEESITQLRQNHIGNIVVDSNANKSYQLQLEQLYGVLIDPIRNDLSAINDLILIPADILHYLSFDMLAPASKQGNFKKMDYLIRHFSTQYAWSAALWAKKEAKKTNHQYEFAGFAPNFNREQISQRSASFDAFDFGALDNVPEVEFAHSKFEGQLFIGDAASEAHFRTIAPDSRIIHLATHALLDDQKPLRSGLLLPSAFDTLEDGYLSLYEIYNLRLQADLALMNACNTGFGPIYKGEGVISLGRAFSYAGCSSIIMSLWLANDRSTSTISQGFYKYLAEGLPKNQALRQAKLHYLNSADQLTAHPYFWANMVAWGEMDALKQPSSYLRWLLLGVIGIVLLMYFFRKD